MQPRAFLAALGANRRGFNQLGGFPWNNHCWHAICSLIRNLQDWLPGVAGTEPRLGYRFWGVNYKKGACTSPLFHFQRSTTNCPFSNRPHQQRLASTCREWPPAPLRPGIICVQRNRSPASTSGSACAWEWCCWPLKKMSGRWGHRPLGRGDGGYSNPKSVWFFWPFCCAREQQDDTQEQTGHYRCSTPENPNNSRLPA